MVCTFSFLLSSAHGLLSCSSESLSETSNPLNQWYPFAFNLFPRGSYCQETIVPPQQSRLLHFGVVYFYRYVYSKVWIVNCSYSYFEDLTCLPADPRGCVVVRNPLSEKRSSLVHVPLVSVWPSCSSERDGVPCWTRTKRSCVACER